MRLLFTHSIKLYKDDKGNLYTHSSYSKDVWERYLAISSELSVITRKTTSVYNEESAKERFEKFDKDKIKYIEMFEIYNSIFTFINLSTRKKNKEILKNAVLEHDCIIARLPSYAGYQAIKYAKKYNKPYLIEIVACPWDGLINHSLKGKIMAIFAFLKLKNIAKSSPYVVYVTKYFLQGRYPTKGKNVNCSNVVLKKMDEEVLNRRLDKISKLDKQKVIIGTTAAVDVRYKGQQYIIEALGLLKSRGLTNFEYHLVGGGKQSYLKEISKKFKVEDQVKFLGPLTHDKVFNWLENVDIYTQPSKQEGLPRALIEAMSMGVPSFGSRTAGIPELLEDEYIFSKKDINGICSILQGFTKEKMLIQAKRNFNEAKMYKKETIEKRRQDFFNEFTSSINN